MSLFCIALFSASLTGSGMGCSGTGGNSSWIRRRASRSLVACSVDNLPPRVTLVSFFEFMLSFSFWLGNLVCRYDPNRILVDGFIDDNDVTIIGSVSPHNG